MQDVNWNKLHVGFCASGVEHIFILPVPVKTYAQNYPMMSSKQTAAKMYKSIDVCHATTF